MKNKIEIEIKEEEIRPPKLFDEFLRLEEKDAHSFFKKTRFLRIKCPACLSSKTTFVFRKNGFSYEVCSRCMTLFVNPRPRPEVFNRYYRDGESIRFLSNRLYKDTESARKKMVQRPKIQLLDDLLSRFYRNHKEVMLVDIGAGYGTFCSEFLKIHKNAIKVCAIEPSPPMAKACRDKGIEVINKPFESLTRSDLDKKSNRIFTCFELIEHLPDPERFLTTCRNLLNKNEIFIFTTLNSLGFDIQLLWEKSKSVFPPRHLNFFNPDSSVILMQRHGFRVLEITTPGRLDVDIIKNSLESLGDKRFWSYFLERLGKKGQDALQGLLQGSNLSSHMVVVAQKT